MPTAKDKQRRHDDKYFAEQWEKLRERDGKRGDGWRRKWLNWQKENAGRAPYSAWLVVPANLADYGARPMVSGTPYWASPFIGVTSPDPSGQPLAGVPNQIHARVFNLGAATSAPTRVEFYWADPSVGLGAADAHHIGTEVVEIPPMSSVVVTCSTPWIPSYLNGGHECAFVSADNHVLDPLLLPFQPWADRHVGQRNLAVLPAVAQSFRLWIPGLAAGMFGEVRVLALRGFAPRAFARRKTPVETLAEAANRVLMGLRRMPRGAAAREQGRPEVVAQHLDAGRIVEGYRFLESTRQDCDRGSTTCRPRAEAAHGIGETLFRADSPPGQARQFELQLKAVDLALNEFVVLNVTFLAGGVVEGGYVLVLANPAWLKDAVLHIPPAVPQTGDSMNTPKDRGGHGSRPDDRQLQEMVIQHNPLARATLEVVQQLAPYLPIDSPKKLGEGLRVGGEHVPAAVFAQMGDGLFPIIDAQDLVRKASAFLRLFAEQGDAYRPVLNAASTRLLEQLRAPEPGARPPIPVLYGRGASLFPLAKNAKEN